MDMKFSGCYYTWSNRQEDGRRVYSKIDSVLINQDWFLLWDAIKAKFLSEGVSDHSPAVVCFRPMEVSYKNHFRFCDMWLHDPKFHNLLKEGWSREFSWCLMFQLIQKLRYLKSLLKTLHRTKFGNIRSNLKVLRAHLQDIQSKLHTDPLNTHLQTQEHDVREAFIKLSRDSQLLMKQQCKLD